MMEDSNEIFLAGGDALVYLAVPLYKKYKIFHNICLGLSIKYVRILGPIFQPPRPPLPTSFLSLVSASAVGLFKKIN